MSRFVIVVLDGFGIGAMNDVPQVRPSDIGAHTFRHIVEAVQNLELPTLERLGLMNAAGFETEHMKYQPNSIWGRSKLMHNGADTYIGHQEIMGTRPDKVFAEPLKYRIDLVEEALKKGGFSVKRYSEYGESLLIVNDYVTVADNVECDPGQAVNVEGAIDYIDYEEELRIGRIVRSIVKVPRVIVFGGSDIDMGDILSAVEHPRDEFLGVNAPKSGVYNKNYHCIHMGYGVDSSVQAQSIIGRAGIPVVLLGKVADVVDNPYGKSFSIVDTAKVLEATIDKLKERDTCFVCCNVQETDLCGHRENPEIYADVLRIADTNLSSLIDCLDDDDILVVMADHGNDPLIGHSHHTREYVPILVHKNSSIQVNLGTLNTLSDVGATACDFFNVGPPANGNSFLHLIQ